MQDIGSEINRNFIVKVNGKNYTERINKRVRFNGLVDILEGDLDLAERICQDALKSKGDVYVRKLRRGLTIRFYVD